MAHIFKYPSDHQKGIIVFTHKELKLFSNTLKDIRFESVNRIKRKYFSVTKLKSAYQADFEKIRKSYFVGIHFGFHHKQFPTLPYADFYMSGPGTVEFANPDEIFHIPFNSRSFTSVAFSPDATIPKRYDIFMAARDMKFKNVDKAFASIRKLYDEGHNYRVLFLILPAANRKSPSVYTDMMADYYAIFSPEERKRFVLLFLHPELGVMGLPRNEVVHFYRQSKVFTLFSDKEGESRVISEAMLCGLPVVVYDKLIGGGRDLLDEENSVQFSSYEEAHIALRQAVEHHESYNVPSDSLLQQTREDYTIAELKKYFEKLYQAHGQTFDGQLINLNDLANRLPGHDNNVPWALGIHKTADILTKEQWSIFVNTLA